MSSRRWQSAGARGNGKSTLATAAAWNTIHHFPDGIIWVGAAGRDRFRMYDIVRTLDTVLGTTLTRVSEDRWGIGILEQLYRRRRLLILDELSGATDREIQTLAEIIGHLHDSGGQSHILLIDRDIHPEFAELVDDRHLQLGRAAPVGGGRICSRAGARICNVIRPCATSRACIAAPVADP